MTEPSKKPSHKSRLPKKPEELPDDQLVLRLFPKRLVDKVNKIIGHEPVHRKPRKKDSN